MCLVRAPTSSSPDVEIGFVSDHLGNDAAAILPEVALSSMKICCNEGGILGRSVSWDLPWDRHICGFRAKTCNLRSKHTKPGFSPKNQAIPRPSSKKSSAKNGAIPPDPFTSPGAPQGHELVRILWTHRGIDLAASINGPIQLEMSPPNMQIQALRRSSPWFYLGYGLYWQCRKPGFPNMENSLFQIYDPQGSNCLKYDSGMMTRG